MSTLAKFTHLTSEDKINTMKPKNVAAIKIMIEIALNDGNYLRNSWNDVSWRVLIFFLLFWNKSE